MPLKDEIKSFRYGGLFGVNCGHYPMVFIPGVSTIKADPQSPEENAETYAESQQQRALERKLREEKRELEIMKAQGAPDEEIRAQRAKVRRASSDIDAFCDETGRTRRRANEYTPVNASWEGADTTPQLQRKFAGVVEDYQILKIPKEKSKYIIDAHYFENGDHAEEQNIAQFLFRTYGGDIELLEEKHEDNQDNPDYLWRGKLWDLKTPRSNKKVNERVRKGLHQIKGNTGGVIIDISKLTISEDEAWAQVEDRMQSSIKDTTDIILYRNGEVLRIKRFYK